MKFAIYTRPGCPYCDKIKQVLNIKGYSYREYILDRDFTREQYYAQFGNATTFPQVILDDKTLGGCSESIEYLRSQNLL